MRVGVCIIHTDVVLCVPLPSRKSNKTLLNIDLRHNRCGDLGIVGEAMGRLGHANTAEVFDRECKHC